MSFGGPNIAQILVLLAVGFVIALWIALPFLIMGTNRRLDRIIRLLQQTGPHTARHTEPTIGDGYGFGAGEQSSPGGRPLNTR